MKKRKEFLMKVPFRRRLHVFLLVVCGLFTACSSDDDIDDSAPDKGDDNKEEPLPEKGTVFADFETYDTTPYFFRYGNSGNSKMNDYYPRWAYSHKVVDNPFKDAENPSSHVLEYTSMEAKNYGLKFRFSETIGIDKLRGIRLQIYQTENVIGKNTWQGTSKAVSQQLVVKLIARFNSVNDYEQEEGILLSNSSVDFQEKGKWMTYTFTFSKKEYNSAATQLQKGIAGMVILPTYGSGTTLAEDNKYVCYIDNIEIL